MLSGEDLIQQLFSLDGKREAMPVLADCFKKNGVSVERLDYLAGSLIFSETDNADGMYFIESGMVRITRRVPEICSEISLFLLGPDECFGISSMMGKPRRTTARAVVDCTLWRVDQETFQEMVAKNPEFAQLVIQGLIKRLDELYAKMKETTEQITGFARRMENLSGVWDSLITW